MDTINNSYQSDKNKSTSHIYNSSNGEKSQDQTYENIYCAVQEKDAVAVQKFIDDGFNVGDADKYGNTPLYYAIQAEDINMVNILILSKTSVNAASSAGYSMLFYAINGGSVDICKSLIHAGANINAVGFDGNSILYNAIQINSVELVQLLIFPREGEPPTNIANVNYVGFGGFSILYHAITKGNVQIVQQLIKADVDVNLNSMDRSPLYQSVISGRIEIARMLLRKKAKVSPGEIKLIRDSSSNSECFELLLSSMAEDAAIFAEAVAIGNLDLINLLVKQGMNMFDADEACSSLYKAIEIGNFDIVKVLIDNGANTNGCEDNTDPLMSTPVLYLAAITKEDTALTKILVENGANVYREYKYFTILHHTVKKCNAAIIELMVTSGDHKINAQTENYCNVLEFALVHSTPEIVEILIKNGACVSSKASWNTKCMSYEEFITKISPENMRNALENSIRMNGPNTVYIDYRIICNTESGNNLESGNAANETLLTLWQISEQEKFHDLLPSPAFVAFIQWMWQSNLGTFYAINVAFCVLLYLNIIWYQSVHYTADSLNGWGWCSYLALIFLTLGFVCREATQLYMNFKAYRQNFENYIEWLLLFYVICLLLELSWFPKVEVVGMCNILMALSMTLLIGHTDYASTPVSILRTVSFTFFKYFTPYALIFISFAYTFHQLFYSIDKKDEANVLTGSSSSSSETIYFFEIVRVLAKFTGELQATDISQNKYTLLPFVINASFIFLCPIIMLNLLNGLAVSNILDEENVKIFIHKSRFDYLHSAQIYYKVPLFKKILHCFGLKLHFNNFHIIYIDSSKSNLKKTSQVKAGETKDNFPLLYSGYNSAINLMHATFDTIERRTTIFNDKLLKEAINIINKLETSRSENTQRILTEICNVTKILSQMNERFSKMDNELEESRCKLNKLTDELMQKNKDLNTIILEKLQK